MDTIVVFILVQFQQFQQNAPKLEHHQIQSGKSFTKNKISDGYCKTLFFFFELST